MRSDRQLFRIIVKIPKEIRGRFIIAKTIKFNEQTNGTIEVVVDGETYGYLKYGFTPGDELEHNPGWILWVDEDYGEDGFLDEELENAKELIVEIIQRHEE